ncbi:MAG: short-chain dehydrogenase/reductase [Frankiales bacterium]|nr:short-chain dehydrogenase/reductase [Frankiales bacterium]
MTGNRRPAGGLEGTAALVTGGGTGIGFASAAALIADGAHVTICGRTLGTLEDGVARLEKVAGCGGTASYVVADVTDEASVAEAVAAAAAVRDRLDTVVANAGGGGMLGPVHVQDLAEFTRVLHLNVLGTMLAAKHAAPHLIRSRGSFVAVSSLAGHVTHRWFGAYPVSKAAIEELVRNMADEYGPAGVRANVVRPGFTATELMELVPRDSPVFQSYLENTPLEGVGEPEDVGDLVRFLSGAEARWITGQVINVDGGHHLRRGPDYSLFAGVGDDPRFGL